jgi:tetratricopeptide (TPR) repeat protein
MVQKIFGQWDALLAEEAVPMDYPYLVGLRIYTRGSAHVGVGDLDGAKRQLQTLEKMLQDPEIDAARIGVAPVSAVLSLAFAGLDGEIKEAEGDLAGAIAAYEAAVELEDTFRYIEPPEWAQPMRHYLGAALLKADRAKDAEAVYRRDLKWNQNNGWSLFGLSQSLEAQGRTKEAKEALEKYQTVWRDADVKLVRSRL